MVKRFFIGSGLLYIIPLLIMIWLLVPMDGSQLTILTACLFAVFHVTKASMETGMTRQEVDEMSLNQATIIASKIKEREKVTICLAPPDEASFILLPYLPTRREISTFGELKAIMNIFGAMNNQAIMDIIRTQQYKDMLLGKNATLKIKVSQAEAKTYQEHIFQFMSGIMEGPALQPTFVQLRMIADSMIAANNTIEKLTYYCERIERLATMAKNHDETDQQQLIVHLRAIESKLAGLLTEWAGDTKPACIQDVSVPDVVQEIMAELIEEDKTHIPTEAFDGTAAHGWGYLDNDD